jgi:His/Glu/Gln/Arg/opine family amino acid ABC transporter permease subunit
VIPTGTRGEEPRPVPEEAGESSPTEPFVNLQAVRKLIFSRTTRNITLGLAGAVVLLVVLILLGVFRVYDLAYSMSLLNAMRIGAIGTLSLVAVVIPIGFVLGFAFGWGRTSHRWLVRSISTAYVDFFRSMPPLVLIAFSFLITTTVVLGIPWLAARIEDPNSFAIATSVLALASHSGAYQAEITRAGIQSVPAGQREAAEAIGLTKGKILLYVVLPQMFRISLPALGNEFASVIKDTSLLSAVGILELTFMGQNLASRLLVSGGDIDKIYVIYVEIALIYFATTFIVSRSLQILERRFRVPGLEAAQL